MPLWGILQGGSSSETLQLNSDDTNAVDTHDTSNTPDDDTKIVDGTVDPVLSTAVTMCNDELVHIGIHTCRTSFTSAMLSQLHRERHFRRPN